MENMERKKVDLNGSMVFVDAIESITPIFYEGNTEYKVRCKSGATYQITKYTATRAELI